MQSTTDDAHAYTQKFYHAHGLGQLELTLKDERIGRNRDRRWKFGEKKEAYGTLTVPIIELANQGQRIVGAIEAREESIYERRGVLVLDNPAWRPGDEDKRPLYVELTLDDAGQRSAVARDAWEWLIGKMAAATGKTQIPPTEHELAVSRRISELKQAEAQTRIEFEAAMALLIEWNYLREEDITDRAIATMKEVAIESGPMRQDETMIGYLAVLWEKTKKLLASTGIDPAPTLSAPASGAAGKKAPIMELRIKTRLVNYLWQEGGKVSGKSIASQEDACDALRVSDRTFRHYKKKGWLLNDQEIADRGYTLEELLQLALQNRLRNL